MNSDSALLNREQPDTDRSRQTIIRVIATLLWSMVIMITVIIIMVNMIMVIMVIVTMVMVIMIMVIMVIVNMIMVTMIRVIILGPGHHYHDHEYGHK